MAGYAAELGFDGVDLTVRDGGHVLPERIADDLPKVAEIVRKAGISMPMITAGIVDAHSPHAEAIVRAMAALDIRYYRWGGLRYKEGKSIPDQLAEFKPRVKELAALNRQYKVCAMYHTHSGIGQVGASQWDLWWLLKDFDPQWVSFNYDIGHATVEGGSGGWIHSARLAAPYMRGVAVKDFRWEKNAKGEWRPEWTPVGDGMVNFRQFFRMLKEARFQGPLQVHCEYEGLGGANSGRRELTIPKENVLAQLRKDLTALREILKETQLA